MLGFLPYNIRLQFAYLPCAFCIVLYVIFALCLQSCAICAAPSISHMLSMLVLVMSIDALCYAMLRILCCVPYTIHLQYMHCYICTALSTMHCMCCVWPPTLCYLLCATYLTLSTPLSVPCYLPWAIQTAKSTLRHLHCPFSTVLSVLPYLHYAMYPALRTMHYLCALCTLRYLPSAAYTSLSTLPYEQCAFWCRQIYTTPCNLHYLHYSTCAVLCTLHYRLCMLCHLHHTTCSSLSTLHYK